MDILTCPWEPARLFIISNNVPPVFYYSHGIASIVSLILAIFLLFKKRNLETVTFFIISMLFFLWTFFDLIEWASNRNDIIYFFWLLTILVELLIYLLTFYLSYIFLKKEDLFIKGKIFIASFLLPVILLLPTKYILTETSLITCVPTESKFIIYYSYAFEILIMLMIIINFIIRFRAEKDQFNRRKMTLFVVGIIIFLIAFSSGNIIGSFTEDWNLAQYGLFGMPIFMAFLAYLIVQYKIFNIKLIGAQALVVGLIILVGSQFFYATEITSMVLTGVTLVLALGFGYILIKSVKIDIERKEQLQLMADSLAQANDQLRKLDNAKTEFISIASHQLRTPVTAIKGFASLLLEGSYGEVSESVHGALEKIYVSSERLVNLIEDLLNVSRIESGRLTFEFANASVEKILKELCDNFILIAKAKKFYLDLKLPKEPLPEFKMDATKIRELVSNFIDNALKYTEKGGATISAELRESGAVIDDKGFVKALEKSPYGKVVRITVSDTGIGIPKEEIPFLFRKFSRGKDVSRLHVGGTGLGLFVGKAIADAHHGATWVESDGTGKGSRFIIEIPIDAQV